MRNITWHVLNPLVKKSQKAQLSQKDVDQIKPYKQSLTVKECGQHLIRQYNLNSKRHLFFTLFKSFPKDFTLMLIGIPFLVLSGAIAPLCIRAFQMNLSASAFFKCGITQSQELKIDLEQVGIREGLKNVFCDLYPYLILICLGQLLRGFADSFCGWHAIRAGTKSTAALLDAIYNKIMLISDMAKNTNAQASLANILFTDTLKVASAIKSCYQLIQMPTELVVAVIYLGTLMNKATLIGACAIFVFLPIIAMVGAKLSKAMFRMATMRDVRSQKIMEILNAIKIVKLFNTEEFQKKRIYNTREKELKVVSKASYLYACHVSMGFNTGSIMALIAIGSLVGLKQFDISKIFTMIYMFTYIQLCMGHVPSHLVFFQDAIVSLRRIKAFLRLPQVDTSIISNSLQNKNSIEISGSHDFAYGLKDDMTIQPELDTTYYAKLDAIRHMMMSAKHVQKVLESYTKKNSNLNASVLNSSIQVASEQPSNNLCELIQKQDFACLSNTCASISSRFQLPAVSYFMDIKNYSLDYFQTYKDDTEQDIAEKAYLHMCIIQYNIKQYENAMKERDVIPAISKLNLTIEKGQLVGIKGPVGSGKSSLFSCILGEMKAIGTLEVDSSHVKLNFDYFGNEQEKDVDKVFIKIGGKVAYCPQNSPVFSTTIKENICFYKPFEEEKYNRIVDICCLLPDFAIFTAGDNTEVGGRGVTLSGGQRARISLARALYNDADIYLLDDPLSAVDAHVGRRIWDEVVIKYLKQQGKTILIVSHQTQYFVDCDRVITIENGLLINDQQIEHKEEQNEQKQPEPIKKQLSTEAVTTIVEVAETNQSDSITKGKLVKQEQLAATGNVSWRTYAQFVKSGGVGLFLLIAVLFVLYQVSFQMLNVTISFWANDYSGWTAQEAQIPSQLYDVLVDSWNDYGSSFFMKQIIIQCLVSKADEIEEFGLRSVVQQFRTPFSHKYFYQYAGFVCCQIFCFVCAIFTYFTFNMKAAKNLYQNMFQSVLHTKLSFFDTTPQGRIINRLVKDTESVDYVFGRTFVVACLQLLLLVGMVVTMCVVIWPCIAIVVPSVIIYLVVFLRFRSVTPQLKRIESQSRSSVFSLCQETLDQLVSIRTYSMQSKMREIYRNLVDQNINDVWCSAAISKWVGFRMTMIGAVLATLIAVAAMIISPFSPQIAQYAGIIVCYGYLIQQFIITSVELVTNVEAEMPAIERMLEYTQLQNECKTNDNNMKNNQAEVIVNNTGLDISNLVMRYRPELPPALKGVNLHVNEKEHVAIVGRTGSGKSSLAITLFKLYQPEGGFSVQLNDEQISHLPLYEARRKIAIIPQEPYLFSGTVRQQLCEFTRNKAEGLSTAGLQRIPDSRLWELLEVVQMADFIKEQPGGLDSIVVGNGENFSSGQRQLICVVRALLRDAEVVVLDEATAYVDKETDKIIQKVIKEYLKDKIVLSIAHRLDTVMGMDKVLVMDQGVVAEYGTKEELMKIENGIFAELVQKAGIQVEEK